MKLSFLTENITPVCLTEVIYLWISSIQMRYISNKIFPKVESEFYLSLTSHIIWYIKRVVIIFSAHFPSKFMAAAAYHVT